MSLHGEFWVWDALFHLPAASVHPSLLASKGGNGAVAQSACSLGREAKATQQGTALVPSVCAPCLFPQRSQVALPRTFRTCWIQDKGRPVSLPPTEVAGGNLCRGQTAWLPLRWCRQEVTEGPLLLVPLISGCGTLLVLLQDLALLQCLMHNFSCHFIFHTVVFILQHGGIPHSLWFPFCITVALRF